MRCARWGYDSSIKLLLEAKADPTAKAKTGRIDDYSRHHADGQMALYFALAMKQHFCYDKSGKYDACIKLLSAATPAADVAKAIATADAVAKATAATVAAEGNQEHANALLAMISEKCNCFAG